MHGGRAFVNALSASDRPKLAARARVQTDRVTGKPVLLYPEGVLMLNATGEAVVTLCDGTRSLDEIVALLAARFGTTPEQVSADVLKYLDRLRERNILEICPP
jgi:pyrroloquinoline quinone biosynthesis protein D